MMRGLSALFQGWLGGPDIHVPVHLAAVGVDNLAVESARQSYSQLGLAHSSGANDADERWKLGAQCAWNQPFSLPGLGWLPRVWPWRSLE